MSRQPPWKETEHWSVMEQWLREDPYLLLIALSSFSPEQIRQYPLSGHPNRVQQIEQIRAWMPEIVQHSTDMEHWSEIEQWVLKDESLAADVMVEWEKAVKSVNSVQ